MRSKLLVMAVVAFCLVIAMPLGANAVIQGPSGTGGIGNSWSHVWGYTLYNHQYVEQFIFDISGNVDWEAPGADSFSEAGWTADIINPDYMLLSGLAPTAGVQWTEYYTGDQATQNFFIDTFLLDANRAYIYGNSWEWTGANWNYIAEIFDPSDPKYDRTAIPEPSTLFLLGTGLLGVVGLARRRKS